jgi:hypothetical protein
MTGAEWRRVRRGEQLSHPLASRDIAETHADLSVPLVNVLKAIARRVDSGVPVDGYRLAAMVVPQAATHNVQLQQVEALWKRGLLDVRWARVPKNAPMTVRVAGVEVTERGRAVLAVERLLYPDGRPTPEQHVVSRAWLASANFGTPGP